MCVFAPDIFTQRHPATLSRRAWQHDADFVAQLRRSWEHQYADYLGADEAVRLVASLADSGALYRHHEPATLLASVRGHPVGVAAFRPMGELSLVTLLEVVPDFRGRGIGLQLLHALSGAAGHLVAHVSIHRPRLVGLYRSAGFTRLQRTTVDHGGHTLAFDVVARPGLRRNAPRVT